MSRYVPDILSKRWVIIAPSRVGRPGINGKKHVCPLCSGNESMTPPEVLRYGKGDANKPGWTLRVIPNLYPITDFHEVIVHSPSHTEGSVENLPLSQVNLLIKAYRDRYNFHRTKGQVIIFCNKGELSGASLAHPHSQLVVIPSQINLDTLSREPLNNIVDENNFFNVYCPDFSQWPYEVWIAPKKTGGFFGDINDEEIEDLANIQQKIIKQIKNIHTKGKNKGEDFSYNYYIYPKENWYLRIIPRFVSRAGFELGTGLNVNVVDPAQAALELKGFDKKMTKVLEKLKNR